MPGNHLECGDLHNAERLNAAGLAARSLTAFVAGDPFQLDPQGGSSVELKLELAASEASELVHFAHQALRKIVDENLEYKKGGIILGDLTPAHIVQDTLFTAADIISGRGQTIKPCYQAETETDENSLWEQTGVYVAPIHHELERTSKSSVSVNWLSVLK